MQTKTKMSVVYITKIGVLAAIATVVMLFEIPLWFAPGFYKLDLSEIVVLIGGFALGPIAAILIEAIKIVLNFVINGTITGGIGEVANLIIGCSFVVPAALFYKYKKKMSGALVGMIIGVVFMTVVGSLLNLYVLLPVYAKVMPVEAIIKAGSMVNPKIINFETLVLLATAPFNLFKGIVSSLGTLLLYKKLSPILHK
ncbi:ECF transporter S component [Paludicola sp. MB14-C6]|uniref:ECF transporter S component n=1 Tax=Paludihabitans sp. MB14-C6 TaxID=3070656 RepID=UPI0027DCE1FD|nr:ECF transporter S component [Paludicola sp. MB14-C6]WMJ23667.1 ECF transporter S component [Paludicola sp. MB14-C6]